MGDVSERPLDPADQRAIEAIAIAYAAGVDQQAYRRVAALFTSTGRLMGARSDSPHDLVYDLEGPDAIETQLHGLVRFDRTFHQLGQTRAWERAGEVGAEVYCTASHFSRREDGALSVYVMHIRYDDRYERTSAGWRFARRFLWIDATEHRPPLEPAGRAVSAKE